MPCFDGMHCADLLMSESNVGALPIVVGDFVAACVRVHHSAMHHGHAQEGVWLLVKTSETIVSGSVHRHFEYKQRLI
jgi:hypothetical protein